MKTITAQKGRDKNSKVILQSEDGRFVYELNPDFHHFPGFINPDAAIPHGCCDKDGNVLILTRDKQHPIVKVDPQGQYITDFGAGLFSFTHMIYVTPQNTLLVPDCDYHVVRELTMDGELIRDFGNFGVPSDSGYEADIWRRMQREGNCIPSDIGFIASWAFNEGLKSIQRMAPPFNKPTCGKMNSKGEYIFADGYANVAVHKFSADGKLLRTWGGKGAEPGKFFIPHSLEVDRMDRVWVADREGNAVHIFDDDGNLLAYVTGSLCQPSDIWSDDEYVYVGERGGNLTIFNMDMDIVATLGFYNCSVITHGLCVNPQGDLFIFPSNSNPDHKVMKLTRIR